MQVGDFVEISLTLPLEVQRIQAGGARRSLGIRRTQLTDPEKIVRNIIWALRCPT